MKTSIRATGEVAKAMHAAYKLATAGAERSLPCPRCRCSINFTVRTAPHDTAGRCTTPGCIRWPM